MRTILILNAKGGCGKSTISTNLASYYAFEEEKKVVLADYDPQGSSLAWLEARGEEWPVIEGVAAFKDDLRPARDTDILIMDAPARVHGKELTAMALEGGWMVNYMNTDFPDVDYKIVEVPKGPAGGGDLLFTNSFGAKADTKYPNAAALLVFYLTGVENQEAILKTGFAFDCDADRFIVIDDKGHFVYNKSTQDYKQALTWYNDLIRPENEV